MELQFNKEVCPCLHFLTSQVQTQEQTQEVRLPDGMPDVGRVLGAWGQVLIRGKEWRSSGMTVSGGVLSWALYIPEDGSEPRMLDTWIPFQMKWDFEESQRDGTIHVWPLLESMDARCVSARKILFRSTVAMLGEAMEPSSVELYRPGTVPEDVQLLKNTYPTVLPVEAGEKQFLIQEALETDADMGKILRYCVKLQVKEQRILANRLVFRGTVLLQVLRDANGLSAWYTEVPFSQYVDLDGSYNEEASATVRLIPTVLELEKNEQGGLELKCGTAAQYLIYERVMVDAVEDAYSPFRSVEMQKSEWELPALLDCCKQPVIAESQWQNTGKVLDAVFYCGYPQVQQDENIVSEKELVLDLEPKKTAEIKIELPAECKIGCYVNIYLYDNEGYEVAKTQETADVKVVKETATRKLAELTDDVNEIIAEGDGFRYIGSEVHTSTLRSGVLGKGMM